jgi:predicted Zn-dependent protease
MSSKTEVLEQDIRQIESKLKNIVEEHEALRMGGDLKAIEAWYQCFPIESLRESLEVDWNLPRTKYSLASLKKKSDLRKAHAKTSEEYAEKQRALKIAKIDSILAKMKA